MQSKKHEKFSKFFEKTYHFISNKTILFSKKFFGHLYQFVKVVVFFVNVFHNYLSI